MPAAISVGSRRQRKIAAMRNRLIPLGLALTATVALTASAGAQAGSFEVASVKPSDPNPSGPLGAAPVVLPALGRLTAQNVTLRRDVTEGESLKWSDVAFDPHDAAVKIRREMEAAFAR